MDVHVLPRERDDFDSLAMLVAMSINMLRRHALTINTFIGNNLASSGARIQCNMWVMIAETLAEGAVFLNSMEHNRSTAIHST